MKKTAALVKIKMFAWNVPEITAASFMSERR